jgi:hypothetical protein
LKAVKGSYSAVDAITVFMAIILLSLIDFFISSKNVDSSQIMEDKNMRNTVNRLASAVVKTSLAINTSLVATAVWP